MSFDVKCDRCKRNCGADWGAIHGIEKADVDGNGTNTACFDNICRECYKAWLVWIETPPASAPARAGRNRR